METFISTYIVMLNELFVMAELKNRHDPDAKDWVILMPRSLGQAIIAEGGITIGLKNSLLRPIPRFNVSADANHSHILKSTVRRNTSVPIVDRSTLSATAKNHLPALTTVFTMKRRERISRRIIGPRVLGSSPAGRSTGT